MSLVPVLCSRCHDPLPWASFNLPDFTRCPSCNAAIYAVVFPAALKEPATGRPGETLLVEEEASCFYHLQKKAVVACQHCGRFLCALCDVDFSGEHLCPRCVEEGISKGRLKNVESRRVMYDDLALSIALVPMIIFYMTFLTAPIALFIAIRYWKAPSSIIPRSKFRMVLAIFIASLQIAGWVTLFYFLMANWIR